MLNSEIMRFGEDLAKNPTLLAGLKEIGTEDNTKVLQFATDHGYAFTMEDVENLSSADVELSDEQLETVAGGAMTFFVVGGKVGVYTNGKSTFVSF